MRAFGATLLPTANHLVAEAHPRLTPGVNRPVPLQLGPGQDLEASQVMTVEFFDRVEEIAVQGHQAT